MQIMLVNIGYPPFIGGGQLYTQRLAESLVAEGHKVIIHTTNALELEAIWNPRKARNTAFRESTPNLEIWRHPLHYLPLAPYSFYLLRRLMIALSSTSIIPTAFLSLLARYAPWLPQLEKTLKRWDGPLDLIHALSIPFEPLIMAAASGADHLGVPLVVTPFFHIGETANNHVSRSCTMRHQVELLQRCNAVITLTESEKEFLAGLGVARDKLHVIGAGINLEVTRSNGGKDLHYQRESPQPFILFLGTVTYNKGAAHLIKATRRLRSAGVKTELVIAGPVVDQFTHYYHSLPTEAKEGCHLLGSISEEEKHCLLNACHLLAMPSRTDSFGLAYLEAWAYHKPVIGAWAGGVPSVVDDGVNGYLVPFGDVTTLADRLQRLISDQKEAQRLGDNGFAKLKENYTWDKVYGQIKEVYRRVLRS